MGNDAGRKGGEGEEGRGIKEREKVRVSEEKKTEEMERGEKKKKMK